MHKENTIYFSGKTAIVPYKAEKLFLYTVRHLQGLKHDKLDFDRPPLTLLNKVLFSDLKKQCEDINYLLLVSIIKQLTSNPDAGGLQISFFKENLPS